MSILSVAVRVEDVMTPRTVLRFGKSNAHAEHIAEEYGFDAVPFTRDDGKIVDFWSRLEHTRVRIRRIHRVAHDASVESTLARLGVHIVQFVYYRSEIVGLLDASDLNRPVARIAWLQPMLELERAVLDAVRRLGIDDERQAIALGAALKGARARQNKARRESLDLPLVEYAQFVDLLRAAQRLHLLAVDDDEIAKLNGFRKRAAHSGDVAVETRADCARLREAIDIARRLARETASLTKSHRLITSRR